MDPRIKTLGQKFLALLDKVLLTAGEGVGGWGGKGTAGGESNRTRRQWTIRHFDNKTF